MNKQKSLLWLLSLLLSLLLAAVPAMADAAAPAASPAPVEEAAPAAEAEEVADEEFVDAVPDEEAQDVLTVVEEDLDAEPSVDSEVAVEAEAELPEIEVVPSEPVAPETVLATVNGVDVTYAQVKKNYDSIISQYGNYIDVNDPEIAGMIKEMAVNYATTEEVMMQKAAELGMDKFTDEELKNMEQTANDAYQSVFEQYKAMFAGDGVSEEDQAKATEEFLSSNGYNKDDVFEQFKANEIFTRMMNETTKDITMEEADVKAAYDEKIQAAKDAYAANLAQFDTDNMNGETLYFIPEGVRAVKHILIMMDQTQAAELKTLQEQLAGMKEDDPARAETQAKIDEIMAPIQGKLDEVQQKIAAGEDFQGLIDTYGEDPGMQEGNGYRDTGYYLTKETKVFEVPFTEAALALEKVGDVSEPVLGSRGFHIIRYDHDVDSKEIEYDMVKEELKITELEVAKQEAEAAAVTKWTEEAKIETFMDRFTA